MLPDHLEGNKTRAPAVPGVSVIIVNWKVKDLLRACLKSLYLHAGLRQGGLEVFMVDNASGDGSVEMVRAEFPDVAVEANERNVGFGAANNQVLARCTQPYVLLLNPDTVCREGAVETMRAYLEAHPRTAIVGSRLENADGSLQKWTGGAFPNLWNVACHYLFLGRLLPGWLRPRPLYLEQDVRDAVEVDWVSGACLMIRRSSVEQYLFDPHFFMYGEDMELCYRMRQGGSQVVYLPAASVIHYQGASMKQQQGDVLLSSLKGPRDFFRMTRGARWLWLFDWLTLGGFFLRWVLYRAGALLPARAHWRDKAQSSFKYMLLAWRIKSAGRRVS